LKLALLSSFVFSLSNKESLGQSVAEVESQIGPGVVVEEIKKKFAAVNTGLQKGDVLLRWQRGNVGGEIQSPFDLREIGLEQCSLGAVTLTGTRGGKNRTWVIQDSFRQVTARPNFRARFLTLYLNTKKLALKGGFTEIINPSQTMVDLPLDSQHPWLQSWLLFAAAEQSSKIRQWNTTR
jgi:hypothetical protein